MLLAIYLAIKTVFHILFEGNLNNLCHYYDSGLAVIISYLSLKRLR